MNLNNLQSTFVCYTIIVCLIILFDACCYVVTLEIVLTLKVLCTRFAWYNTILKTKKCKIGGIDAERILDIILLVFFAQSKYQYIFFQRKENGKVLYISFSGQLLNHQKITHPPMEIQKLISAVYSTIKTPFIISFHFYKKAIV